MADRTVKVNFIGDASSLKRATDAASASLSKVGDSVKSAGDTVHSGVSRIGASVASFAKIAGAGLLAGGAGLAVFGKGAISAASSLAESLGKSNVVFGQQAKEIEAWAGTASKAFGQSKQQALEAAGTYGNLFQAFGVGRDQSAKMSKSLVELAADLASFNNTSVDDALEALRSGLSGETEPLKKFGVALSDERLKLEAVRLGLIKTTKDGLTPAAKAQASYALIMKDTVLAQGDFARTSDGLANRTRILKARFADIQAEIGTKLLPIVVRLAGFILDKVLPAFTKLAAGVGTALAAIRAGFAQGVKADGFIGFLQRIGAIARAVFTEVTGGIRAFVAAFKAGGDDVTSSGFAGFLERLGLIARSVFNEISGSVKAFVAAFKAGGSDVTSSGLAGFFERLGLAARAVFDWLKANGPAIFDALKTAGEAALKVLVAALEKLGDILVNVVWPAVKRVFEFLDSHREVLVGIAVAIGVGLVAAFLGWAAAAGAAAVATIAATAPIIAIGVAIAAAVAGVIYAYKHFEAFRHVVDATGRFLRDDFLPILKGIGAWLKDVFVPAVVDAAKWLYTKLTPAFKAIADFITSTVLPALRQFAGFFVNDILPVVQKVIEAFVKFSAKVIEVAAGIVKAIAPSVKTVVEWFIKFETFVLKAYLAYAKFVIGVVRFAAELGVKVVKSVAPVIEWFVNFEKTIIKGYIAYAKFVIAVVKAAVELGVKVGQAVAGVVKWVVDFGKKVFDVGKSVVEAIGGIVGKFVEVAQAIGAKVGEIVGFFVGLPARIASEAGDLFGSVKDAISSAASWVGDRVGDIVDFVKGIGSRIGQFASDLFFDVKFAIVTAKNFVSDKVDDIIGFFKALPGNIASFFGGLADTITSPFRTAFNEIAKLWNSTVGSLSFTVPSWVPIIGGNGWDVPDIPTFDVGGVVKGPLGKAVLAIVHAGETILPTHKGGVGGVAGVGSPVNPDRPRGPLSSAAAKLAQSVKESTVRLMESTVERFTSNTVPVASVNKAVFPPAVVAALRESHTTSLTRIERSLLGGRVPQFDVGGIVKGPKGQATPAILHAGETVLPTHKMSFERALESVRNRVSTSSSISKTVLSRIEKMFFGGGARIAQFDTGGVVGGGVLKLPAVSVGGNSRLLTQLAVVNARTPTLARGGSNQAKQPINMTVVVELDGKTLATSTAKYANSVGGIDMRVRARS